MFLHVKMTTNEAMLFKRIRALRSTSQSMSNACSSMLQHLNAQIENKNSSAVVATNDFFAWMEKIVPLKIIDDDGTPYIRCEDDDDPVKPLGVCMNNDHAFIAWSDKGTLKISTVSDVGTLGVPSYSVGNVTTIRGIGLKEYDGGFVFACEDTSSNMLNLYLFKSGSDVVKLVDANKVGSFNSITSDGEFMGVVGTDANDNVVNYVCANHNTWVYTFGDGSTIHVTYDKLNSAFVKTAVSEDVPPKIVISKRESAAESWDEEFCYVEPIFGSSKNEIAIQITVPKKYDVNSCPFTVNDDDTGLTFMLTKDICGGRVSLISSTSNGTLIYVDQARSETDAAHVWSFVFRHPTEDEGELTFVEQLSLCRYCTKNKGNWVSCAHFTSSVEYFTSRSVVVNKLDKNDGTTNEGSNDNPPNDGTPNIDPLVQKDFTTNVLMSVGYDYVTHDFVACRVVDGIYKSANVKSDIKPGAWTSCAELLRKDYDVNPNPDEERYTLNLIGHTAVIVNEMGELHMYIDNECVGYISKEDNTFKPFAVNEINYDDNGRLTFNINNFPHVMMVTEIIKGEQVIKFQRIVVAVGYADNNEFISAISYDCGQNWVDCGSINTHRGTYGETYALELTNDGTPNDGTPNPQTFICCGYDLNGNLLLNAFNFVKNLWEPIFDVEKYSTHGDCTPIITHNQETNIITIDLEFNPWQTDVDKCDETVEPNTQPVTWFTSKMSINIETTDIIETCTKQIDDDSEHQTLHVKFLLTPKSTEAIELNDNNTAEVTTIGNGYNATLNLWNNAQQNAFATLTINAQHPLPNARNIPGNINMQTNETKTNITILATKYDVSCPNILNASHITSYGNKVILTNDVASMNNYYAHGLTQNLIVFNNNVLGATY